MSYVDTSVIVAALDSEDPRQAAAIESLERRREKVVSELVLLELANILVRRGIIEVLARNLRVGARRAATCGAPLHHEEVWVEVRTRRGP